MHRHCLAALLGLASYTVNATPTSEASYWHDLSLDYQHFYTQSRLFRLGSAFSIGAVLANSSADQNFRDGYQEDVRNRSTDDIAKAVKSFGEGRLMLPLTAIVSLSAELQWHSPALQNIGDWGQYTSRAYLLGIPPLLLGQKLTGASRPEEQSYDSAWRPFKDNNGVSGHSFIGAVPFLSLAKMTGIQGLKITAITASTLAAWSRVNDDAHYLSQALLGWYLAWESVDGVMDDSVSKKRLSLVPYGNGVLLNWEARW